MYLDNPAFAVSFPLEDATKLIEETIKKKHWTDFEIGSLSLAYTPYWICNYESYSEKEDKTVSESTSGSTALNAVDNTLSDAETKLYFDPDFKTEKQPSAGYEFNVSDSKTTSDEAREILSVRLAEKFNVPKQNIIISGLTLRYVPFWVVSLTIGVDNYRIRINAVTGRIVDEEKIPEKEKGWLELTSETLSELKEPGAWLMYAKDTGAGIASSLTPKQKPEKTSSEHYISQLFKLDSFTIVLILAVIAVIVVLWAFG